MRRAERAARVAQPYSHDGRHLHTGPSRAIAAKKKKEEKKICTRGDFRPSLRACVRSAELIHGNTPRRKVCFTTFAPRGAAEMRRGPPRARHLIWSD